MSKPTDDLLFDAFVLSHFMLLLTSWAFIDGSSLLGSYNFQPL